METCFSYKIKKGDTLQALAVRFDIGSWTKLVYINALKYPFIIDKVVDIVDKQPNIAYLGDTILIPASSVSSIGYISKREMDKRLYGSDLKLSFEEKADGTKRLDSNREFNADILGDIEQISGIENVTQALMNRLTTRKNELPMHPDYGSEFMDMLGKKNTKSNLVKLRLELMETFKKDIRVLDIKNCIIKNKGTRTEIECDVYLKNKKEPFKLSEII